MSENFISARGVHKTYSLGQRRLAVLRGVDVEVPRGEFLALRGASGAGKSTLLHLLGGLDTPSEGAIFLTGEDLGKFSRSELAQLRNQRVGFIFQSYYLLPELDALENVCLPARMARKALGPVKRGRGSCWRGWDCRKGWSTSHTNCRAANSSAWRLRAR